MTPDAAPPEFEAPDLETLSDPQIWRDRVETVLSWVESEALSVSFGIQAGAVLDRQGVQVGPLVESKAVEKVSALVSDAVAKGATVVCGGENPDGPGFFFEPTVFADVPDHARIMHDEPFGPLDAQTRLIMHDLLLALWSENRKAVMFVTHDLEEAIALDHRYADHRVQAGAIAAAGQDADPQTVTVGESGGEPYLVINTHGSILPRGSGQRVNCDC